jgi:cytochrome c oxidase cbb3-type subunit I/II
MYYFLPKAAERPVYSYRLSIIHFWALIFIYIWAGPHHLLYTALPDWAQSLGTVFSVMLIAPSWGGMINGLLTLRGAWDKVRDSVVLKFMVVAITAYGMATFEGPLLSLKNVNAISHFTDWTIAHVHVGALGWNGFLTFAVLYWLIPKMFGTKLWSNSMANAHFWLGTLGIVFYAVPMYWAGFTQSLNWKTFTDEGQLQYTFLQTVDMIAPMYKMRSVGGLLYLIGGILMVINLWKTVSMGKFIEEEAAEAPALVKIESHQGEHWHRWIERKPIQLLVLSLVAVAIGGVIEMVPTFLVKENIPTITSVKPYTPLELHGRDIYISEGCYTCHSQMVRPFRDEVARYGEYSKSGEFVYDHPFQWGSKRTGPDLARVGKKYSNDWHFNHMYEPSAISDGSIMPRYPFLLTSGIDIMRTPKMIKAMQTLGVPYEKGYHNQANQDLDKQAKEITADLMKSDLVKQTMELEGVKDLTYTKMVALIAYLQRIGTDIKAAPVGSVPTH